MIIKVVFTFLLSSSIAYAQIKEISCTMSALDFKPTDPIRFERFVAFIGDFEISVQNFKSDPNIDVFPEPPISIKNKTDQKSCDLDGGIWVRSSFYADSKTNSMIFVEYSGSESMINIVDMKKCTAVYRQKIAAESWQTYASGIVLGRGCRADSIESCRNLSRMVFSDDCKSLKKKN